MRIINKIPTRVLLTAAMAFIFASCGFNRTPNQDNLTSSPSYDFVSMGVGVSDKKTGINLVGKDSFGLAAALTCTAMTYEILNSKSGFLSGDVILNLTTPDPLNIVRGDHFDFKLKSLTCSSGTHTGVTPILNSAASIGWDVPVSVAFSDLCVPASAGSPGTECDGDTTITITVDSGLIDSDDTLVSQGAASFGAQTTLSFQAEDAPSFVFDALYFKNLFPGGEAAIHQAWECSVADSGDLTVCNGDSINNYSLIWVDAGDSPLSPTVTGAELDAAIEAAIARKITLNSSTHALIAVDGTAKTCANGGADAQQAGTDGLIASFTAGNNGVCATGLNTGLSFYSNPRKYACIFKGTLGQRSAVCQEVIFDISL